MSYCVNPDCPDPGGQKVPNPDQARFCSNCGMPLRQGGGDRYRALALLGRHGISQTFLAVDEHQPGRPRCILKQFDFAADSSPHFLRQRFGQVARRIESFSQHAQIATWIAQFEDKRFGYWVEQWVEGQSLAQGLEQNGIFRMNQVRQFLGDALSLLQIVHADQVIHGDLKLQNLIHRRGDRQIVLVDFGAAAVMATTDGLWLNQPSQIERRQYAHPVYGSDRPAFSADLYDLGVLCIQLLTQKPPQVLFDRQQNLWRWRPFLNDVVDDGFSQILLKLLHRSPAKRYQNADQVLLDLEAYPVFGATVRPTLLVTTDTDIKPKPQAVKSASSPVVAEPTVSWRCLRTFKGHTSWVRAVALSQNDQILISGSGDKTVKIWSVATATELHTLTGHTAWVRSVAISPDHQRVASGGVDKVIRLWDPQTGDLLNTLTGHNDGLRAVTFSADGLMLASASQDQTIKLWEPVSGQLLQTFSGHKHWVIDVAISPNSKLLASGSHDHTVGLWSVRTGKAHGFLTGHSAEVLAIAISPSGRLLASGSADHTVMIWRIDTGKLIATLSGHTHAVNALAFSPDSKLLATASSDKTIKLWRTSTGELIDTLTGHKGWVWSVAFSHTGQAIASGSWDGTAKYWVKSAPSERD